MKRGIGTVIYPAKDVARAKILYGALLGVAPVMDEPYYVGYKVDDQDIGLDPNGHSHGMTGPVSYFDVSDIKTSIAQLVSAGAETQQDATDVGGGKLIATVKDQDGNVIGLCQPA
jgi:predicted enzyme related to lactoylglutathione lyase